MAYGLDIGSALSSLVGLSRRRGQWRLGHALVLPGFKPDPEQRPETYASAPLGTTWAALSSLGVRAGAPSVLVPGRDVFYRFTPSGTDPRMIERQVQMEADELGGGDDVVLADHIAGCDFDYSPVIHIGLARESVIDHYAGCLRAMGIASGPMVAGCAALFSAWKLSGDNESEHVSMVANIGDETTDVILVREGGLLYARTITFGVEDFLNGLLPEYSADRDEVRRVLFAEIDLRPAVATDNIAHNRGVDAGQDVASRLFQQITGTLMLAKAAQKSPQLDARKVYLCGPGAGIPGLRELMMNRTRKQVEIFDPLAGVDIADVDDRTLETVNAYRPALALAVGLARIQADRGAERITFLPAGVRRRREFLSRNLFLYLAAAIVLAVLVPLYIVGRSAADSADAELKRRQQAPIGRYLNASSEIALRKAAQERAQKRVDATTLAVAPGRVATQVLTGFAHRRPATARLRETVLETRVDAVAEGARGAPAPARTFLRMSFFIQSAEGADPIKVKDQLRELLKTLPGVLAVVPGAASENPTTPGMNVDYDVELDLGIARPVEAPKTGGQ